MQVLENQVNGRRGEVEKIASVNRELVKGLVGVRSGSTVLRDLQLLRTPEGVQLSQVLVEGTSSSSRAWRGIHRHLLASMPCSLI